MDKHDSAIVKKFVTTVNKHYPNSKIYLFGSKAKGTSKPDSDFDFLIVNPVFKSVPFEKRAPAIYRLKRNIHASMDIICATPPETKRKISVIREALREGIEVS